MDNKKTEQQKIEHEKKNEELANCYKRMAKTDDGKIIMKDLERYLGYNKSSVCRQQPNQHQTFYCEGLRAAYLYINEKINREIKIGETK